MSRSIAAAYGIAGLSAAIAAIAVFAPMPDRAEPAPAEPIAVEEVAAPAFVAPTVSLPAAPLAAEAVASQDASPRAQRLARAAAPLRTRAAAPAAQEEVVYVDERGRPIDPRMASAAPRWEREEDEDEEHEEREHSRRGGSRERDDD